MKHLESKIYVYYNRRFNGFILKAYNKENDKFLRYVYSHLNNKTGYLYKRETVYNKVRYSYIITLPKNTERYLSIYERSNLYSTKFESMLTINFVSLKLKNLLFVINKIELNKNVVSVVNIRKVSLMLFKKQIILSLPFPNYKANSSSYMIRNTVENNTLVQQIGTGEKGILQYVYSEDGTINSIKVVRADNKTQIPDTIQNFRSRATISDLLKSFTLSYSDKIKVLYKMVILIQ